MIDEALNEIIIDESEIRELDKMFGTKSKVFPSTDTIVVETQLDYWELKLIPLDKKQLGLTNKKYKNICLLHRNLRGRKNKCHIQAKKGSLLDAYHSIYCHKKWMFMVNASNNTYKKEVTNE